MIKRKLSHFLLIAQRVFFNIPLSFIIWSVCDLSHIKQVLWVAAVSWRRKKLIVACLLDCILVHVLCTIMGQAFNRIFEDNTMLHCFMHFYMVSHLFWLILHVSHSLQQKTSNISHITFFKRGCFGHSSLTSSLKRGCMCGVEEPGLFSYKMPLFSLVTWPCLIY